MYEALSPYDLFTPIHPAWLHRRHEKKLDVTRADLDSIQNNFPAAIHHPLFADYLARANAGKLYLRRGRKPDSLSRGMLWSIFFAIEEEKAEIWEERRRGARERMRGDHSPVLDAAQHVADRLRLNCTGQSLLNRLARERIPKNI